MARSRTAPPADEKKSAEEDKSAEAKLVNEALPPKDEPPKTDEKAEEKTLQQEKREPPLEPKILMVTRFHKGFIKFRRTQCTFYQ